MLAPHPPEESLAAVCNDERPSVLVVDDDPGMRETLSGYLARRGFDVTMSHDVGDALRVFEAQRPTAVILGLDDDFDALPALKRIDRDVPIIATSRHGRTTTIVRAIKLGAADFISKPFSDTDLDAPLQNALRQRRVAREIAQLRQELQVQSDRQFLFASTPRMAEVADVIQRVADTDVTILLRGASGTGKELAARAVHQASARRDRPLVKVNCAALPSDLLESELFGYERGAFAAATQAKPGKFEFAHRGTLFLDEIGGLGAALQARLVEVLHRGEFTRIGGAQPIPVDVRIIAATNRDLERAVADGQFRADLLGRLSAVTIRLPELKERREEIPTLTQYFLKKYSVQYNKPFHPIDEESMRLMLEYDWPGNVRELENLVTRFVVFGNTADLRRAVRAPSVLAPAPGTPAATPVASAETVVPAEALAALPALDEESGHTSLKDIARAAARQAERAVIARMLLRTRWNRKEAAESLGISYKALLYKIKENGLDKAI